jgi:Leucine Rich Repeat
LFINFIGIDAKALPVSGAIPSSITKLTKLEVLNLNSNFVQGKIPWWLFQKLSQLRFLDLFFNEFTGTLPGSTLAEMSNLEYLDISQNPLHGVLPTELGQLSHLTDLRIARSDPRGYPDGFCPSPCLNGTIPTELGKLVNLRKSMLRGIRICVIPEKKALIKSFFSNTQICFASIICTLTLV